MNKLAPKPPYLDIAKYAPTYASDHDERAAQVNKMHRDDANALAVCPYQLRAISEWWDSMSPAQRQRAVNERMHQVITAWDSKVKAKTNLKRQSNA